MHALERKGVVLFLGLVGHFVLFEDPRETVEEATLILGRPPEGTFLSQGGRFEGGVGGVESAVQLQTDLV